MQAFPLFNNFNELLQSEEPIIHLVHGSTIQLANGIIKPDVLRDASVTELNLEDSKIYKFPLSNKLIIKAGWIDVQSRIDSKWESMEFFINRFKAIFQQ